MKTLFKGTDSTHFYTKSGDPRHDADLRVARKELLLPSPTSIDKSQFVNAFLERWKKEQVVIACVENPRMPHESLEQYAERVEELSNTKSREASEFGGKVHGVCEKYPLMPIDGVLMPYYDRLHEWHQEWVAEVIETESVLIDLDIGVAGRTDLIAVMKDPSLGRAVVDFKTQNLKPDDKGRKKPNFYPSWIRQLSFYGGADSKKNARWPQLPTLINVVIDSTEASKFYTKVWAKEEALDAYNDFVIAANNWCRDRGYWPCGKWDIVPQCPMPVL